LSFHGSVKYKVGGQSQKEDGYQGKTHQGEKYLEEYTSLEGAVATEQVSCHPNQAGNISYFLM
jgi:hypothetical protein